MAYENFKPIIWSKKVLLDLEKQMVMRQICNTNYEGEVGRGKTVRIICAARPTVRTYVPGTAIVTPEQPPDDDVLLPVDQYKYFNISVDDVDAAQADVNIMSAYAEAGALAMAEEADTCLAKLVAGGSNKLTKTDAIATEEAALKALREAFVMLWNAGVKIGPNTYIGMSPWFYDLVKNALQSDLTNNEEMIKRGIIGTYNGAKVLMSNNLHNDGTYDNLFVAHKNAVTFADGIEEIEAYRPESSFSDAIKCLHTFGAKIVRPKEIVTLQVKQAV